MQPPSQWPHACKRLATTNPSTIAFTAVNMRLIDIDSYLIKDFIGDDTPPYAILSHTWGPEEVTLKDMQAEFGEDEEQYPQTPLRGRGRRG
ncbi:HET-domain-containing protein [Apiospora kogelbergensis]|uniref:HET-domain-containing protein n=1 Tax=Apiospora kogelbergensis TaxID=1337665 RepID=A0AAW0RAX0_9PEZI